MKALTLWRPWPWAIFHAHRNAKRIENRPWKPWPSIIGKPIVLHAGKTFYRAAVESILHLTTYPNEPMCLPAPASDLGLIGVATVTGFFTSAAAAEEHQQGQGQWFTGPFAWLLTDVRAFKEPIICDGRQGLWDLPRWAEARVREELR